MVVGLLHEDVIAEVNYILHDREPVPPRFSLDFFSMENQFPNEIWYVINGFFATPPLSDDIGIRRTVKSIAIGLRRRWRQLQTQATKASYKVSPVSDG